MFKNTNRQWLSNKKRRGCSWPLTFVLLCLSEAATAAAAATTEAAEAAEAEAPMEAEAEVTMEAEAEAPMEAAEAVARESKCFGCC